MQREYGTKHKIISNKEVLQIKREGVHLHKFSIPNIADIKYERKKSDIWRGIGNAILMLLTMSDGSGGYDDNSDRKFLKIKLKEPVDEKDYFEFETLLSKEEWREIKKLCNK